MVVYQYLDYFPAKEQTRDSHTWRKQGITFSGRSQIQRMHVAWLHSRASSNKQNQSFLSKLAQRGWADDNRLHQELLEAMGPSVSQLGGGYMAYTAFTALESPPCTRETCGFYCELITRQ